MVPKRGGGQPKPTTPSGTRKTWQPPTLGTTPADRPKIRDMTHCIQQRLYPIRRILGCRFGLHYWELDWEGEPWCYACDGEYFKTCGGGLHPTGFPLWWRSVPSPLLLSISSSVCWGWDGWNGYGGGMTALDSSDVIEYGNACMVDH